ncbi:MAG TPA: hypothetical protein VN841_15640 [Bryobacteraceae bacterium]|nr:hypothetical protein [Bryobacteraceae bacterium]
MEPEAIDNPMDQLKELVSKLEHAYSGRLVSVVLYGSGATLFEPGGTEHDQHSDLNVLCVLKEITPRELSEGEPVLRWWQQTGHPAPLLLTEEEVHRSADCFPIEFRDMKERRRVLFGPDPISDLHIDTRYYRAQVEYQLRTKLLRLRQQGASVLSDPAALLRLCVDSVTTFIMLGRHGLELAGAKPKTDRRAVLHQLTERLKADMSPLELLLDIREDKSGTELDDPGELFAQYLVCINRLVEFVDGLGTD